MDLVLLPNEVLRKIFSYMPTREVAKVSEVCWKFHDVSRSPSLWRNLKISLPTTSTVRSFCRFITKVPYVQALSIDLDFVHLIEESESHHSDLNFFPEGAITAIDHKEQNIFDIKSLTELRCIVMRSYSAVNLPASLKHFTYFSECEIGLTADLTQLYQAPVMLQHLGLCIPRLYSCKDSMEHFSLLKLLIAKYLFSLKSLKLRIENAHCESLLPLIANCTFLKELTLMISSISEWEESSLGVGISELTFLEKIIIRFQFIENWDKKTIFSNIFNKKVFPKLRYLSITLALWRRQDFNMLKCIPNLETFIICDIYEPENYFYGNYFNYSYSHDWKAYIDFIQSSQTLKNVGHFYWSLSHSDRLILISKMLSLQKEKRFDSICLCQYFETSGLSKVKLADEYKFLCKECYVRFDSDYNYTCIVPDQAIDGPDVEHNHGTSLQCTRILRKAPSIK